MGNPLYEHYQWIWIASSGDQAELLQQRFGRPADGYSHDCHVGPCRVCARSPENAIQARYHRCISRIVFFPTRVTAITGIYQIQDRLGFINKTWTLVFPYTALNIAIGVFIMRGVFETVSKEIVDAARVDGAGPFRTLVGILLPIIKNGVVVVIIVSFVAAGRIPARADVDERRRSAHTASLHWHVRRRCRRPQMAASGRDKMSWPSSPPYFIFGIAQRWYTKGLQEGALKA